MHMTHVHQRQSLRRSKYTAVLEAFEVGSQFEVFHDPELLKAPRLHLDWIFSIVLDCPERFSQRVVGPLLQ